MDDYLKILKMIEEVDPNDTAKLNEIDARVWSYLNFYEFNQIEIGSRWFWVVPKDTDIDWKGYCKPSKKYTRSRDALKAIRPNGWVLSLYNEELDFDDPHRITQLLKCSVIKQNMIATLATEELAELHAIIQAIAYERGLNE